MGHQMEGPRENNAAGGEVIEDGTDGYKVNEMKNRIPAPGPGCAADGWTTKQKEGLVGLRNSRRGWLEMSHAGCSEGQAGRQRRGRLDRRGQDKYTADWGSADVGRSNGLVAGTLERRDEGWRIGRKRGKRRVGERREKG
ncbi:uncharacterized protein An17g01190, partial [Aspergillus niger]|uniref:Uncharacterized protein n=2 Tax=Aspergillus niger TaxID=5061 RepID=A0AAJ8E355_ASPNG